MARNQQKQEAMPDIEELKSECLYLCSEILSELDQEVLPKRRENFTKNEELKLANQSTVGNVDFEPFFGTLVENLN
jgi:hypothetical protein